MFGLIFGGILLIAGFIACGMIDGKEYPGWKTATPIIGIVLCIVLVIISCVSYVPTGYTGIVTTFGKVHENTLDAGLNIHAPWDNVITMDYICIKMLLEQTYYNDIIKYSKTVKTTPRRKI